MAENIPYRPKRAQGSGRPLLVAEGLKVCSERSALAVDERPGIGRCRRAVPSRLERPPDTVAASIILTRRMAAPAIAKSRRSRPAPPGDVQV